MKQQKKNKTDSIPTLLEFETERLKLWEITWDDLDTIHQYQLSPDVDRYNTLGIPEDIQVTKGRVKLVIEAQNKFPRVAYHWKITLKDSAKLIGMAGMNLSKDRFKLAEIYYGFYPEYWNKGYATELSKELIKIGFEHFKLHKIEAGVATENTKSIRVLEKAGMTYEGLRRKILPIRGEWKDGNHYGILEDDPRDY